jgi:hypothetical protein
MATSETPTKRAPHETERHSPARERSRHVGAEGTEQLIFTLNTATRAVIKIERIDPTGKRSDVSDDQVLAKKVDKEVAHEIEAALDEAFEAGISSMFGQAREDEEQDESEEEVKLRQVLLRDIVGQDIRQRLQRRLVQRLILSRMLKH